LHDRNRGYLFTDTFMWRAEWAATDLSFLKNAETGMKKKQFLNKIFLAKF
jgi:hypothetical protein